MSNTNDEARLVVAGGIPGAVVGFFVGGPVGAVVGGVVGWLGLRTAAHALIDNLFKSTPQVAAEPSIRVDDVLLVNLADPRIVHSPETTLDFTQASMRVIALTSVQGPDFLMAKKEGTFGDPREFILSVPRSAIIGNLSQRGGGFTL